MPILLFYFRSADNPAAPLTLAQELDRDTEKIDAAAEGLEVGAGDGTVVAPLITPDFVKQESEAARVRAAMGYGRTGLPGVGGAASSGECVVGCICCGRVVVVICACRKQGKIIANSAPNLRFLYVSLCFILRLRF